MKIAHYQRYIGLWKKIRRWIAFKILHLASVYTPQLWSHLFSCLAKQTTFPSFIYSKNQHFIECIVGARHCPRCWGYKRTNADVFWITCCSLNLSGRLYCHASAIKFPFPGRSFSSFPPFLPFYCRHLFTRPRKDHWAGRDSSHL